MSHLTQIGEELSDGTEIAGRFFQVPATRVSELVPSPEQLKAFQWESGATLGELLTPEQVAQLKRAWGSETAG